MNIFKKAEPQTVQVKGIELICPVCSCKEFWTRKAQLNRAITTFFGLDAADHSATCFVCSDCTYIYWFLG